ncbi:GNAT family N-acetyltransferase [Novispirillum itersonii]|uniref:GNAT family N-acetyltransferase n=1 Tax=Novispirillum itersonii TaxID=189 RepID=UPI0005C1CFB8|nr:GNAT family N-acetyltransferase [Novispirillum itersonii]
MHPYATEVYARSLMHLGSPVEIPEWESWAIIHPIADGLFDVSGPYPLSVISRSADLSAGLERLRKIGAVSVTLVLDGFNCPSIDRISECFDIVTPFKTHYVVDRSIGEPKPSKHHRYEIRRALECVTVRQFALKDHLPAWIDLYANLSQRHGLKGVHDFPKAHHEALATMQNIVTVGAFDGDILLAAHIWVFDGDLFHSHLAASSEAGYALGAAYAVNDHSIRLFSQARIINLGGSAGHVENPDDGLARFKRGFANSASSAYICGKILDEGIYERLATNHQNNNYFPAYRGPTVKVQQVK